MTMMYTPRHSARRIRRIERRMTRRKRWNAAILKVGVGACAGAMVGVLLGLMFVV
jgi:uncharacterized membrane protein